MYKFGLFIGRFQPYHNGHHFIIQEALKRSEQLIVLIGSANAPRSFRNPWSYQERREMIESSCSQSEISRIQLLPLMDCPNDDDAWVSSVKSIIAQVIGETVCRVAIFGYPKDPSSYYLKLFPEWESVELPNYKGLNATTIRKEYFSDLAHFKVNIPIVKDNCPIGTQEFLLNKYSKQQFECIFDLLWQLHA
jgi:bifunctional NMN adenylyltransferase/nudix hydrolase